MKEPPDLPQKQRIVVVDDAPVNIRLFMGMLGQEYEVDSAQSGEEALELIQRTTPDLVLLDVMMPGMDGFEVCRRIKEDKRLKDTPVIFVTAMGDAEAESRGLQLGAADYLAKPINIVLAKQRISNLMERERLRKQIVEHRDRLEAIVAERTLSLSIAKEAAEAANIAKGVFLSKMSHELRTPMNAIIGMTEVMRHNVKDPTTLDQLDKVAKASGQLLGLINNIIEVSKIGSEQLSLTLGVFRFDEVLRNLLSLTARRVWEKGLRLSSHLDPNLYRLPVYGDSQRLGQILLSLVDNAIKFTPAGSIILNIDQLEETREGILIRFEVVDDGIGISPENQKRLFSAFEQLGATPARTHGGTGLGLLLCRQLVELMGGEIGVESQVGLGSTFWFTVRLSKRPPSEIDAEPAS